MTLMKLGADLEMSIFSAKISQLLFISNSVRSIATFNVKINRLYESNGYSFFFSP